LVVLWSLKRRGQPMENSLKLITGVSQCTNSKDILVDD
jgi:hypothetical protein